MRRRRFKSSAPSLHFAAIRTCHLVRAGEQTVQCRELVLRCALLAFSVELGGAHCAGQR
jgi:hypothetical protein